MGCVVNIRRPRLLSKKFFNTHFRMGWPKAGAWNSKAQKRFKHMTSRQTYMYLFISIIKVNTVLWHLGNRFLYNNTACNERTMWRWRNIKCNLELVLHVDWVGLVTCVLIWLECKMELVLLVNWVDLLVVYQFSWSTIWDLCYMSIEWTC